MLRLVSAALGSFIASPVTPLEGAACPDGLEDEAAADWPGVAGDSLVGCVEQPKTSAVRTANGMTRTADFMVGSSLKELCCKLYLYKSIYGSRRYYFLVEHSTRPCRP